MYCIHLILIFILFDNWDYPGANKKEPGRSKAPTDFFKKNNLLILNRLRNALIDMVINLPNDLVRLDFYLSLCIVIN